MSITNKLVANIKQTQVDITKFTDTSNVICIDTCNNRIGINTKTPRYSIDIYGTNGKIFVSNLEVAQNANFYTISGTTINCLDGSFTRNLDASFINFKTISGSLIRATTISGVNIIGICGDIIDLSGTNIKLSNELRAVTISANTINATTITTNILNASTYNIERGIFTDSITTKTADFSNISVIRNTRTNISGGTIDCSNLNANFIVSTRIHCLETLSAGTVSTDNLMSASGSLFFTLSNGQFYLNTGLGDDNIANIQTLITEELQDDLSTNVITAKQGYIFDCCINNLTVTNIDISRSLTLPQQTSGTSYTGSYGSLAIKKFENSSINSLAIYNSNSRWSNIFTATQYATIDLSSNSNNNIVNYNIRSDINILPNYRYIPIKFKMINASPAKTELFNINNNNYIELSNTNFNSGIYEINASITLSYNNTISGDVEPNDFTFGLYDKAVLDKAILPANSNINSNITNIIFETSYNYVKNKNLILAFDNSYNYSSVSLNYIGPLFAYTLYINNYKRGLCYLVSSQKDISHFNVEYFSSTIKLLNYDI
jgi:hypothetical protein|uniref:Uncharacterized protein n=1 Tax=viral metagenome TaxID=1070528 RepID=A0A6C0CBD3_9ZZZZ